MDKIDLNVKISYIQDLLDDVLDNKFEHLYEFIGKDVVRAFYFGFYFEEWKGLMEPPQVRLYSREMRHLTDKLENYSNQINFWNGKYR